MDSFEVENFRSLKHLKLEKLARVNLLVGKNNSGKTSVLESLFALAGIEDVKWISIIESERGLDDDRDFRYLFYGFDTKNTVKITATHPTEGNNPAPKFEAKLSIRNRTYIKESDINTRNSKSMLVRRQSATALSISISSPVMRKPIVIDVGREDEGDAFSVLTSEHIGKTNGLRFPGSTRYVSSEILTTSVDSKSLSEKIEDIKFNKLDGRLIDVLQTIDSRIDSISLSASGKIYLDLGRQFRTLLPFNLMGEGIQRLLDITTAIIHNAGGIVLIDEIDNGLHYSALRILWKGILQAAREYDVQVFATTHSAEALRHLTWVLDEEENASFRNDVAAYTLIRAKDDEVKSYRYNYGQLEFALERGIEVRN